ncbi:hypothetical protein AADZ90_003135 [Aestuariibius sp. 2305UL40-4]|uniref:hypothetical protein n=1 Tax=Aestuariibius violaceus TaxID=3234132 RepID=UPI00345ECBD7
MALAIFRHAIAMVFRNFIEVIKLSLAPIVLGLALYGVIDFILAIPLTESRIGAAYGGWASDPDLMMPVVAATVATLAILLFVFSWIAVLWHRFILLEEYPALLPRVPAASLWGYLWRTLLLGGLTMLLTIPAMWAALLLIRLAMIDTAMGMVIGWGICLVCFALVLAIGLRLALILPAAAVGRPVSLRQSWAETRPACRTILVLSGLLILIKVAGWILVGRTLGPTIVGAFAGLMIDWLMIFIGVSIVTTLYGHLIEGRPLP